MISRSHKIRMMPTKAQERVLRQTVGTVRYAYNWALRTWNEQYQEFKDGKCSDKPSAYKLCNRWTQEKPEWASLTGRISQSRAILNVGTAFTNFWKNGAGRPAPKKRGKCRESFYISNTHAKIKNGRITIPLAGKIKLTEELRFDGKIESYTVSHYAGQWHVSVQMSIEDQRQSRADVVGVDVGMSNPAIASDGTALRLSSKIPKLQKRLKKSQKQLSRRKFASKNYDKQKLRKQRIQLRINNLRQDAIHKFTSQLAKNHGTIGVETLNIAGMHKSPIKNIRTGFQRSCMAEVLRQLQYKAVVCVEAPRNFPSTQLCSACGSRQKMAIQDRTYKCPSCSAELSRDLNAAINLKNYVGTVSPDIKPVEGRVPSDCMQSEAASL